jgi:acid phosphatase family membrane protein YuiD
MARRIQTNAWLHQMGGRLSGTSAHVTGMMTGLMTHQTGISAEATAIAKVMSTATFQMELAVATLGENALPFPVDRTVMALQILQCAAVMT